MVVVRLFFSGDQAHKSKKMTIKISIFWTSTQNNIFFFCLVLYAELVVSTISHARRWGSHQFPPIGVYRDFLQKVLASAKKKKMNLRNEHP